MGKEEGLDDNKINNKHGIILSDYSKTYSKNETQKNKKQSLVISS
jgi:hypothetical protein